MVEARQRACLWFAPALLGAMAVAVLLRFWALEVRPFHADEATNAWLLDAELRGERKFDPTHFHGPLLHLFGAAAVRLAGESGLEDFRKATLRFIPAIAGVAAVAAMALFRPWWGASGALAAAWLAALSPLLAYYSRMYIQESHFGLLGLLGFVVGTRFLQTGAARWGAAFGLALGLMFASKATFALTALSWALAVLVVMAEAHGPRAPSAAWTFARRNLAGAGAAAAAFVATAALLYSDFGRDPAALWDAVRSYWVYQTDPGHAKGPGYYLALLFWPKHFAGIWWTEAAIALLALAGLCIAHRHDAGPPQDRRVIRAAAYACAIQFGLYAMIGYKTPWLMVLPMLHLILVAGFAARAFALRSLPRPWRIGLALLALGGLWHLGLQARAACFRLASDRRNPYTYSPTSPDAENLAALLARIADAHPPFRQGPVAVIGKEYWPLPWYLRAFPAIGYWAEPPPIAAQFPLAVAMPAQSDAAGRILADTHFAFPRGLRHETPVTVFVRKDAWEAYLAAMENPPADDAPADRSR